MLIFDAHLDLAMNAVEWNRDLRQPVASIRAAEQVMTDKPDRGRGTVSLPEMRAGQIGVCVATLIARVEHRAYSPVQGWRSPAQAWAITQAQRAWYQCMEDADEMRLITNIESLDQSLDQWQAAAADPTLAANLPIGFILSLEGADSLVSLDHLHRAHAAGLRIVGPAHYGPGVYAQGTDATGGLNQQGVELLDEMSQLGMILDVTHFSDECFWQALDRFDGPIWASHQMCRALVPHQRQFSDEQLLALISRGGVIGAALDAWMLVSGWERGQTTPQSAGVTLANVVDHIDHVCQLAGNAGHCGIGSDLDGAFGFEQTPCDLNTIGDLASIPDVLRRRGYDEAAIAQIAHGNFLRFLRQAWSGCQ